MANFTGSANAICPYYLRETPKSISCEGFTGLACLIRFASPRDRLLWAAGHCESFFYARSCPYARMLEELYG